MAMLFMDSCDWDLNGDPTGYAKWAARGTGATGTPPYYQASQGRFNNAAMRFQYDSYYFPDSWIYSYPIAYSGNTIVLGFAIKASQFGVSSEYGGVRIQGDVNDWGLGFSSIGEVLIVRTNTGLIKSSGYFLNENEYNFVEMKIVIDDTSGSVTIKVAEEVVVEQTGIDTRAASNGTITIYAQSIRCDFWIDDWYLLDGSGPYNNDFLGDCRIEYLYPNGNGNYSQWMGSDADQTNNYLLVDDTTFDGDTTFVTASGLNLIDTYTLTNMNSTTGFVKAVQYITATRKDDSGYKQVATVARINSTDYVTDTRSVGVSYQHKWEIRETNPNTTNPWEISDVNSLELGVKVIT